LGLGENRRGRRVLGRTGVTARRGRGVGVTALGRLMGGIGVTALSRGSNLLGLALLQRFMRVRDLKRARETVVPILEREREGGLVA